MLGSPGSVGGRKSPGGSGSLALDDYVTGKTPDGLFTAIGEQEQSMPHNPAARATGLLKTVFGGG